MTEKFWRRLSILVLVDEDGIEHLFELLAELEIENDKYRVLVPWMKKMRNMMKRREVVILKVIIDEEGNELLSDIDDETEWEMVVEAWQELVDSEDL